EALHTRLGELLIASDVLLAADSLLLSGSVYRHWRGTQHWTDAILAYRPSLIDEVNDRVSRRGQNRAIVKIAEPCTLGAEIVIQCDFEPGGLDICQKS